MSDDLVASFRWQAEACRELGSPFYGSLIDLITDDLTEGGPIRRVVRGYESDAGASALALRLMGTVHGMVLSGEAPLLAEHYPSVGGDGDPLAAAAEFVPYVADHEQRVRSGLVNAPQTNEVGRSAALFGALLHLRPDTPVRLFELGASAGLNMLADRFRYLAADGDSWGPVSSPVVLEGAWDRVPSHTEVELMERRGTDLSPVDITSEEGALTLTSYVWPDQITRLERLRAVIGIAHRHPVVVETGGVGDFLTDIELVEDTLTVVWHSIMWQYVAAAEQERASDEFARLIDSSTSTARFVHVSFEPHRPDPDQRVVYVVAYEDRNGEHIIGEAAPHGIPTRWY